MYFALTVSLTILHSLIMLVLYPIGVMHYFKSHISVMKDMQDIEVTP